jgi:Ca2+:H+ antiporter
MPKMLKPSLNWLLIFFPISVAIRFTPALHNETWLFICSCLAIIPMAGIMGKATEHLAARLGEGIGGLLNATFGNAAELIIALMALHKGLPHIVKASLTGSILGNILLVFGLSAVVGGWKRPDQRFNRTAAQSVTTSLMLAALALLIPTVFHASAAAIPGTWSPKLEQQLSLAIAIVLFLTYLCTLYFSLRTHKSLFSGAAQESGKAADFHAHWSVGKASLTLLGATALVALLSEFMVGSVEGAREKLGVTEVFIGVILVAIIGNAAEHSTAVLMALKDKMDLSLGIAAGSSLQVALLIAPILVFASYAFGRPMDLEFTLPEVVSVLAAVVILAEIAKDGQTNWLEGAQLLSVYLILGIFFYFLPEPHPVRAR